MNLKLFRAFELSFLEIIVERKKYAECGRVGLHGKYYERVAAAMNKHRSTNNRMRRIMLSKRASVRLYEGILRSNYEPPPINNFIYSGMNNLRLFNQS